MTTKRKYFYTLSLGISGCDQTGLIETACKEDEIYQYLREESIDNAQSYGYEQDEDHFGDYDQVGRDWNEEEEDYSDQGTLEYWFEDYVPDEHDCKVISLEFEEI